MSTEKSELTKITINVTELQSDLEMGSKYGASPETVNEKAINYYSNLKKYFHIIASERELEGHRNWLVQQACWLLDNVKIGQPLKFDLVREARKWLEFHPQYNYSELSDCLHIYYWLKRERIGIKSEGHFYRSREQCEILTSEQLDAFYNNVEKRHKVYSALANEIYPPENRFYPDPLATPGARMYYDLYSRLLAYPDTERPLPADVEVLE
jgi:hypothetical protein